MSRVLIEVAIESVEDAIAAETGGADRLELCAALDLGGLTPSLGAFLEVRAATKLPVWVMIRPRAGDFVYSDAEVRVMARDLDLFHEHSPDGFVFGVLGSDGRIDTPRCRSLRSHAADRPCAFHRAFDKTPDGAEAVDELAELGFRRLLTSGGAQTAYEGVRVIGRLLGHAAGRIEVLPCGRVRAADVEHIVR